MLRNLSKSVIFLSSILVLAISIGLYDHFLPSSPLKLSALLRLARANTLKALKAQPPANASISSAPISTPTSEIMSSMKITPRFSKDRGNADHGWLKTFHTFSFASYQGSGHEQYGSLRVINEDRVAPKTGFGTHSHQEFEIFSYVVRGELAHQDSMGNTEIIKRGDIQLTSAGTGISHSEKAHGSKEVHFLQIWSVPSVRRLKPKYFTRHFPDSQKENQWACVVAPVGSADVVDSREGDGPAPVQSPLSLFATLLSPSKVLEHKFAPKRKGYVHVIQTSGYNPLAAKGASIKIDAGQGNEVILKEGDGAYLLANGESVLKFENVGDKVAEVLLFDLE